MKDLVRKINWKKQVPYMALLIILVVYYVSGSETKFDRAGVSFTAPKYWTVVPVKIDSVGRSVVEISTAGGDEEGQITIIWEKDSLELNAFLDEMCEEIPANMGGVTNYKKDGSFRSKYQGRSCMMAGMRINRDFRADCSVLVKVFYHKGYTVCVAEQAHFTYRENQQVGFDAIQETLVLD